MANGGAIGEPISRFDVGYTSPRGSSGYRRGAKVKRVVLEEETRGDLRAPVRRIRESEMFNLYRGVIFIVLFALTIKAHDRRRKPASWFCRVE